MQCEESKRNERVKGGEGRQSKGKQNQHQSKTVKTKPKKLARRRKKKKIKMIMKKKTRLTSAGRRPSRRRPSGLTNSMILKRDPIERERERERGPTTRLVIGDSSSSSNSSSEERSPKREGRV